MSASPPEAVGTRVKICGLRDAAMVRVAAREGAWAVGVVFADGPRSVGLDEARAALADAAELPARVGVFVDPTLEELARAVEVCGLTHVQLHASRLRADEVREAVPGCGVVRGVRFTGAQAVSGDADLTLYDAAVPGMHGGTGVALDWDALAASGAPRPFGVAGGLRADNVERAIAVLRPDLVDTSSGVESSPGVKDARLIAEFCAAVRAADDNARTEGHE